VGRPKVMVVGAGVAGLTAAFRLQQRGCDVTVLESEDRVGGKTASVQSDGFVVNTGATVLAGSYEALLELARDVGISERFFPVPTPVIGVAKGGRVYTIRGGGLGGLVDFVRTPLLSVRSKFGLARMASGLLRSRTRAGYEDHDARAELDTETVAQYCRRRLNAETCDHLLAPVLGGIFVVEGRDLSMADLWFTLWKVLRGGLLGYRGGVDVLARAVAARLDVRTNATVLAVSRSGDGAVVRWASEHGVHERQVDGVVISVPAPQVGELFPELAAPIASILRSCLQQANFVAVRLALTERPRSPATLVVAGPDELGGIATVSYEHNLSPGAAPAGKGLLGVLLYHEWATPRLGMSDQEFVDAVLRSLEVIEPGISKIVQFSHVTRWIPGALKSTHGTHRQIARLNRLIDPDDRVQLAGDYLGVPSVNGSIVSGDKAAERLSAALGTAFPAAAT
jgi:oxygen-dependent protoporphyrinogen oxidase